jgi:uncharacterized membrane protein
MKKDISLFEVFINIAVFLSLLFIMIKLGSTINNNMPKETLEDKLFILLAYAISWIGFYYITKLIYRKLLQYIIISGATSALACMFYYSLFTLISLFRTFVG